MPCNFSGREAALENVRHFLYDGRQLAPDFSGPVDPTENAKAIRTLRDDPAEPRPLHLRTA